MQKMVTRAAFIVLLSIVSCEQSIIAIDGNFTYCNTLNEKSIVNLDFNCSILTHRSSIVKTYHILVMSKLHYVLDTYGVECYKKRVQRQFSMNLFGAKSDIYGEEQLVLSRIECLAMVQTKRCDNEPMACDEDGCLYNKEPTGQFLWMQTVSASKIHCKFHRRRVSAEHNNSLVFSNARSSCKPSDLSCSLANSIVVWNASDVALFMYAHVHMGFNYTLKGDILYSTETMYLFQLTATVQEANKYELHKTTEGLYIYMVNANMPNGTLELYTLEGQLYNSRSDQRPRIADLMDIANAERDFELNSLEGEFKSKIRQEFIKDCSMFQNYLNSLTHFPQQFHRVRDLRGQEAIVYSRLGQLLVPQCQSVGRLTIVAEQKDECFVDVPVEIQHTVNETSRQLRLFLTNKNFLVDKSPRIECSQGVRTRQLLNKTHFLIRVNRTVKVAQIADLKLVDLTSQNLDFESINYRHHGNIIDGFEMIDNYHEPAQSNQHLEEKFHIFPEDHIEQRSSLVTNWASSIIDDIKSVWISITSTIGTTFLLLCVFLIIGGFLFLNFNRAQPGKHDSWQHAADFGRREQVMIPAQ